MGREEQFAKAAERCRKGNALRTNNSRCVWYKKLSKVCLVIDYLPVGTQVEESKKGGTRLLSDEKAW